MTDCPLSFSEETEKSKTLCQKCQPQHEVGIVTEYSGFSSYKDGQKKGEYQLCSVCVHKIPKETEGYVLCEYMRLYDSFILYSVAFFFLHHLPELTEPPSGS